MPHFQSRDTGLLRKLEIENVGGGVNEDWQWGGVIVVAGFPMLGADFYCLIHFILPPHYIGSNFV